MTAWRRSRRVKLLSFQGIWHHMPTTRNPCSNRQWRSSSFVSFRACLIFPRRRVSISDSRISRPHPSRTWSMLGRENDRDQLRAPMCRHVGSVNVWDMYSHQAHRHQVASFSYIPNEPPREVWDDFQKKSSCASHRVGQFREALYQQDRRAQTSQTDAYIPHLALFFYGVSVLPHSLHGLQCLAHAPKFHHLTHDL